MEAQEMLIEKSKKRLKAGKQDRLAKRMETISTILLSAATVLSAWCIFQSAQWSGEQYFRIDDETAANQFRLQYEVAAAQRKSAKLQLFLQYAVAISEENSKLANFLYDRFPPTFKNAFDTWKAFDPANNPDAPKSPFEMKEYVVPEVEKAAKYAKQAAGFKNAANVADNRSDNYVLVSLALSMVLFFCGLSGVTESNTNKRILIGIAFLIFISAMYFISTMHVMF